MLFLFLATQFRNQESWEEEGLTPVGKGWGHRKSCQSEALCWGMSFSMTFSLTEGYFSLARKPFRWARANKISIKLYLSHYHLWSWKSVGSFYAGCCCVCVSRLTAVWLLDQTHHLISWRNLGEAVHWSLRVLTVWCDVYCSDLLKSACNPPRHSWLQVKWYQLPLHQDIKNGTIQVSPPLEAMIVCLWPSQTVRSLKNSAFSAV